MVSFCLKLTLLHPDCIGFFPQMILSGLAVIILLIMLVSREFDGTDSSSPLPYSYAPLPSSPTSPTTPTTPVTPFKGSSSRKLSKSEWTPTTGRTSSIHIAHNDLSRLIRHLNGEFVFPPPSSPTTPEAQIHRRNRSERSESDYEPSYWMANHDAQSFRSNAPTVLNSPVEGQHSKII